MVLNLRPNILVVDVNDGVVVLDRRRGTYFSSQNVGAQILRLLRAKGDLEALILELSSKHAVEEETIRDDIKRFGGRLCAAGICDER